MSFISESLPDLLGGVSQLAPQRRSVNEVESMVNCQLRPAEGVTKRPPTKWIAEVAASAAAYSGAFVHPINKNENERFWVIVLDGDLKVFNAVTGVEVNVNFPDGKTYLDVVASPNQAFRLATFNETTVIANRETEVEREAELSSERGEEGLIVITQGDFDAIYQAQIVFYAAPFGSDPAGLPIAEYTTPTATISNQIEINTTRIAENLAAKIDERWGTASGLQRILVKRFGSTLHILPGANFPVGGKFWMRTFDGLADQGMSVIKDSIPGIEELPGEAPIGFRVKVEGDKERSIDDVWFEFTSSKTWKETTPDGIPVALKASTLPLELIANPNYLSGVTAIAPVVTDLTNAPGAISDTLLQTKDGVASTEAEAQIEANPGTQVDRFYNLGSANGSDLDFNLGMILDETQVVAAGQDPTSPDGSYYDGDEHTIEVAVDQGAGFILEQTLHFGSWALNPRRFDFNFTITTVPQNSDVRIRLISAASNIGALILTLDRTLGGSTIANSALLELPSSHYAPSTALSFTLNGTAFSDTYVAGGTRAEYMTNLKTVIEAYGGATAVTATIDSSGFIRITNDDGTNPTLTSFVFDDNLDLTLQFFNGSVDFTNLGVANGQTIKNTTDGSSATVSAVATTVLTHDALSGGVNDVWRTGDKALARPVGDAFVCRQPTWAKRLVGSEETNAWPSFEGEKINEVSFLKNRLVFLSDENVVMSQVDSPFNVFRTSTQDILDSDRIDIALSGPKTSSLHSAFTWNEELLVWSELGQFVVNGEPFLSPNTVKREGTTAYVNTRKVKPVVSERAVYFLTEGNEFVQLWDYKPTSEDATSAEGNRLSVPVPRYMPGAARGLLAISDPEVVLVLTATDPDKLYVFSHLVQDQERAMAGWHEWEFEGVTQILGMGSIDNEVSLVLERDDGKVHLEVLDLWELSDQNLDGQEDSDDQTPPTFDPDTVVLGLDTYSGEAAQTFLSAHTSDSGFGTWSTNISESIPSETGGFISAAGELQLVTVGGAGGYRCANDLSDGDMHVFVDIEKIGNNPGNFPHFKILVRASTSGSYYQEGLGMGLFETLSGDNAEVKAIRHHQGGAIEESVIATAIVLTDGSSMRFGFRLVGNVATYYRADAATGANEVSLGSFTFGSISSTGLAQLTDGFHKGCHLFSQGATSPYTTNAWKADQIQIEGDSPTVSSTTFTPLGLDPQDFPILIGVDALGNEATLRDNGDGTASWVGEDKTGANVVMGLPMTSTIQLSRLFHRKNFGPFAGQAEMRGSTYIHNLILGIEETTTLAIAIAITGHVSFSQDLTEVRSLDGEYMYCHVGGRNNETTITISSSDASNFRIVGLNWEGVYYNRTRRMS